jgi:non-homologous end joining protein Ku
MERALAELTEKQLDLKLLDDEYASALRELAEAKRDLGRDVVEIEEAPAEDEQESADVIDIMAVLKERMGGAERKPARAQSARKPARAPRQSRKSRDGSKRSAK